MIAARILCCAALWLGLFATLANAEEAAAYRKVPASADGIGKAYMGREIAQVMGWQGAAWLASSSSTGRRIHACQ